MTPINPTGFPPPIAPYSSGTIADGVVYVSGMLAFNPDGSIAYEGDAAGQTRHILEMIRKTIEEVGGSMADVTFNHVFLTDWANYAAINEVYAEYFPGAKPARYCIRCDLARLGLLVEIASIAHVRGT